MRTTNNILLIPCFVFRNCLLNLMKSKSTTERFKRFCFCGNNSNERANLPQSSPTLCPVQTGAYNIIWYYIRNPASDNLCQTFFDAVAAARRGGWEEGKLGRCNPCLRSSNKMKYLCLDIKGFGFCLSIHTHTHTERGIVCTGWILQGYIMQHVTLLTWLDSR